MNSGAETHGLVDHLFRERSRQMVAWLTRVFGPADLALAEEVVQDALLKALQQWPFTGVPRNPAGWLFEVARNGALDALRRRARFASRTDAVAAELTRSASALMGDECAADDLLRDDELRMIFLCCHPALSRDAQVALSLKTVGGFSVDEIARAFLVSETTIAQRLVRAKRQLKKADVRFELPSGSELARRLDAVLEVIYLLFNEGYSARQGDALIREDVCREALRLARIVAEGEATSTPAAHAVAALLAFQSARLPARVDALGEMVLLDAQDRSLWDPRLIGLGFRHLAESADGTAMTTYHVQAAIAAAHAAAPSAEETQWAVILGLYDDLLRINPSPVVQLNRVVAVWKVRGVDAALSELATLEHEQALAEYYLLPVLKAQLCAARGDRHGAATAYEDALRRPCTEPERRLIRRRHLALVSRLTTN